MFKNGNGVLLRNLPPSIGRFEGLPANVDYGLRERQFRAWKDDYEILHSYVVEVFYNHEYREIRVPAVCVYPREG